MSKAKAPWEQETAPKDPPAAPPASAPVKKVAEKPASATSENVTPVSDSTATPPVTNDPEAGTPVENSSPVMPVTARTEGEQAPLALINMINRGVPLAEARKRLNLD